MNELSTEVKAKETHEKAVGYFKVSEQYGYKFIMEVKKIRDDRCYRELGYSSFESYCENAWGTKRDIIDQRIQVASTFNESDFADYNREFGHGKTLLLARMPEPQREQTLNEGIPTERGNKSIGEATQQEINEYRRKYKEAEQAKQRAEAQAEQARKSERIMQNRLEEAEDKEPEVIEREIIKEVIPDDLQQEIDSTKRVMDFTSRENDKLKKELDSYKLKDTSNFDEEQAGYELKKIHHEADRSTAEIRLAFKQMNDKISVSKYMHEAISVGNDYEKKKLKDEMSITRQIINNIEASLNNRREIN